MANGSGQRKKCQLGAFCQLTAESSLCDDDICQLDVVCYAYYAMAESSLCPGTRNMSRLTVKSVSRVSFPSILLFPD